MLTLPAQWYHVIDTNNGSHIIYIILLCKIYIPYRNTTTTGGLPATSGNLASGIILAYCFAIQYIIVYFIIILAS
jgi:hypothetical protein